MMEAVLFITVLVTSTLAVPPTDHFKTATREKLSDYIKDYGTVYYVPDTVHTQHTRLRRSSGLHGHLDIGFQAHDQDFKLRLRRDLSAFSNDFVVENSHGQVIDVDTSHIYHGELADEANSQVYGSVTDGVFEGKIVSHAGTFFVENARRYFPNHTHHSIIYMEEDVVTDPYKDWTLCPLGGCSPRGEGTEWVERIQNMEDDKDLKRSTTPSQSTLTTPVSNQYLPPTNNGEHLRSRRMASSSRKNTCSLYIRTDPTIWRHVKQGIPDYQDESKRGEVMIKARGEIISMVAQHVTALNYIFSNTKFDGRYEHRNIKFQVQRLKIDDEATCNPYYYSESRKFCVENITEWDLLKLHANDNHEDFCLSYLFTYRDFTNGVLGLSFLASTHGRGGICEKSRTYTERIGSKYESSNHSLNTGFITLANHGSRVPPLISQLNFAHQVGHNFGSPNDYPPECRPGGEQGNYLMYEGTSGDRPNNSRFSPCSIRNISEVLDAVLDGRKRNCFTASEGSFCGNNIVEEGEECDCGFDDIECKDRCCYPRMLSEYDKERNRTARGCTRKAFTQCRCQFLQVNVTCREASDCSQASYCSGVSAECPERKAVSDHTECSNGLLRLVPELSGAAE